MYAAPEVTTTSYYDQKVDIYSLGVILFEMCHPPLTTGLLATKLEFIFCFLLLEGKSMTPHRGCLLPSVPPSNSLVSVSNP